MNIKSRNAILQDIIKDARNQPDGWNAIFGRDTDLLSRDCYISHPDIGIYLLKEHTKNPFETHGAGAKIARRIDDDIQDTIQKNTGDFGIVQGNIRKILRNIERGVPPEIILNAALHGDDLGFRIPVRGLASQSEESFSILKHTFSKRQKQLDVHFEKLMTEDGIYNSYS